MKKFAILLIILLSTIINANAYNPKAIYKCVDTSSKAIALTFDDGPHPEKTAEILAILKKHDVKATFFLIGANAERYPETVKQIINEGHEIGNHTYTHNLKSKATEINDAERFDKLLEDNFGYKIKLFRPPGGIIKADTESIAQKLGYKIILWNIDTKDWAHKSTASITNNILSNCRCGSIVLMHDYITGESHTEAALDRVIPKLKKEGYSFLTVSNLLETENRSE